ncbi:NACHT and ankyrin domain-containing protein [Amylocarpus encephaloides]|uniref:NACHT and ankyrin domain-containing protein n=1 Tax=Amylocarpus encephaloides TaxID=45428 RepID=A0A9P7Y8S8_9HELO|nr:NACHT and ankyrin domain-containing protein [Amylocarpus encephaloides]
MYGGTGRAKTPLTLFLIDEFEKMPNQGDDCIILYYFCERQNHTRNHPVSVIRGLMLLLITARPDLIDVLMPDYENQRDSLFCQNDGALEVLWKNFVNMARDPRAGRVYCIIDGLDQCAEEPLDCLLDIIKEFYEGEEEQYRLQQNHNAHPGTQQQSGGGLQMLLLSREAPTCISEALGGFPRIPLKPETKRPTTRTTNLATIAREALRQKAARAANESNTPSTGGNPSLSSEAPTKVQPPPKDDENRQMYSSATDSTTHTNIDLTKGLGTSGSTVAAPFPEAENNRGPTAVTRSENSILSPSNQDTVPELPVASTLKDNQPMLDQIEGPMNPVLSASPPAEYVFDDLAADVGIELEEDIEEEVNDSVAIYIEERIANLATERGYSDALRSKLSTGLEDRGDGTFLWVDLALEEIMRYQPQDAELVLAQLPGDPNDLYCRVLQSIPQNMISLAIAILRWVLAARRPLMVHELGAALLLLNYQSSDTRALTLQGISACGSMLTVQEDDTVQITHNSVIDLLTDDSSPLRTNASLSHFYVHLGETDSEIASLCLQYLERGCLQEGAVLPADGQEKYFKHVAQYPLFPYAVEFWPSHLREATRPQINLNSSFFIKTSKFRKHWWLTYWPATTGKWSLLAPGDFTLLHIASYLDLPFLAQQLMLRGELPQYLDVHDNHGYTPIYYAAERGHLDIFVLLLQQGAKVDDIYGTAFEIAARKGQAQIVEHLIKQGQPVDTRAQDVSTMKALKQRAKYFKGIVNEGISTDRDHWRLMTKDTGQCGTALHEAALYGHVSVMEVLLKWNANVRVTTTKNWTPLHASSWTGQTKCVKLLLEKGADATAMTDFGWMPYHCAASRGKTAVIELYVKLGLEVDIMTKKQKTALHLAAWAGNAATVRMLVSFGAAVDVQSYKGETPLHLAVRHNKPEIVELLLASGANKHVINKDGLPVSDILRNIQGGGTSDQKEMLRILDQFGMLGYVSFLGSNRIFSMILYRQLKCRGLSTDN